MNDISVVIVTENAQDIIRDCLESVKWTDEIIVVDAASRDRTLEIASEYTKKIIGVDPALNSGQSWNRGINAACKQWIFTLESDKRITQDLRKEIVALIRAEQLQQVDGYFAKTRNYFLGRWMKMSGLYPDYKLYLFKKDVARFEERHKGNITFHGRRKYLNSDIEHLVYRSLCQCIDKINQDSSDLAQEYFSRRIIFKITQLITKPLRIFKKQYFRQKGKKEGLAGLAFCLISCFERFLLYAKLWHLEQTRK